MESVSFVMKSEIIPGNVINFEPNLRSLRQKLVILF